MFLNFTRLIALNIYDLLHFRSNTLTSDLTAHSSKVIMSLTQYNSTAADTQSKSLYLDPLKAAPYLKRLVAGFPPRRPGLKPGSSHVGSVVGKVALGQVFSEYFGFPCQSSFH
jgi:hypothetical protein